MKIDWAAWFADADSFAQGLWDRKGFMSEHDVETLSALSVKHFDWVCTMSNYERVERRMFAKVVTLYPLTARHTASMEFTGCSAVGSVFKNGGVLRFTVSPESGDALDWRYEKDSCIMSGDMCASDIADRADMLNRLMTILD